VTLGAALHFNYHYCGPDAGGTGHFNLAQGLVALSTGLGAAASNVFAGFVVQVFEYTTGFLALAAIAAGGLFFFASFMPETKPEDIGDEVPSSQPTHSPGAKVLIF
jgi:hypothetical protein